MTNQDAFKQYWASRVQSLEEVGTSNGQLDILRFEAKKAWTQARMYEHESILESNVIINKGIWQITIEQKKKNGNNNGKV